MKKKGTKLGNFEILKYLDSGYFKQLTTKQGNSYIRCSVCRATLYKKGQGSYFHFQNGHEKNCSYKIKEGKHLEDLNSQIKTKGMVPYGFDSKYNGGFFPKDVDNYKVSLKLTFPEGLRGEAKMYEKTNFGELPFYDNKNNFNLAGDLNMSGYSGGYYRKFDGTIVLNKI